MSITSDLIRGHTDTIILAQLLHKDSYGYEINKAIQERAGADTRQRKPRCIRHSGGWKRRG